MAQYRRIRDLREDADLTQDELATQLKMHKTTYTNYEQGKREPPLNFVVMLAQHYNVSLDYIAGLVNECRPLNPDNTLRSQFVAPLPRCDRRKKELPEEKGEAPAPACDTPKKP